MKNIRPAIKTVLTDTPYAAITIITTLLALSIYYASLVNSTPWDIFVDSNKSIYVFLQVVLSIINAVLIGIVISMFVNVLDTRKKDSNLTFLQAFASLLFSVAATGCTVCGAVLLPTLGIAASLTALPFGGLEIKFLTILLLIYSIYEYSKIMAGECDLNLDKIVTVTKTKDKTTLSFNQDVFMYLKPVAVIFIFFGILVALPKLPADWRMSFAKDSNFRISQSAIDKGEKGDFSEQINPDGGYGLGVSYGDIGFKTVESGAIDLPAFIEVYENAGQPLTEDQIKILTKESDEEIVISHENAYFLLNFFWAFGLANKNPILTEGDIAQYGDGEIGDYASTGGWSLASKDLFDYYSKTSIVKLNSEQQKLVEEVSSNIFRPCCGNSTAFPDCNHGMALLGILELMAANGATENEMYEAAKYINAFWFPETYNDLAMYFKATEDKDYHEIDAKKLLSSDYSSGGGYQSKKAWLQQEGILPEPPKSSGGGCGV